MLNILIAGGAGFVGSNLAEKLSIDENNIYGLDNLSNGDERNLEWVKGRFLRGDILNFDFSLLKELDFIFHLACQKMVLSIKKPFKDLDVNAKGTLRILEFARKKDVPVLFTSTGAVYGNPKTFPTLENSSLEPESHYGVSKLSAEKYCRLYHRLYGLKTYIARLHTVYGPKQRSLGVISIFIKQGLSKKPFTIHGDGKQSRCFTFIDDCVDGLLKISSSGESGEAYNISGKPPHSINELAETVAKLLKVPVKTVYSPRRKGDQDYVEASTVKLQKLGWKEKTSLKEGIRKTIKWWKSQ